MSLIEMKIKRAISIPTYFNKYINPLIDLADTPKICCPFHKEDTPSFTYSEELDRWRCWGKCKTGGDVIELHRFKHKLETRDEACTSLAKLLGISLIITADTLKSDPVHLNYVNMKFAMAYNKALSLARDINSYKELDLIMSENKSKEELTDDLDNFAERLIIEIKGE